MGNKIDRCRIVDRISRRMAFSSTYCKLLKNVDLLLQETLKSLRHWNKLQVGHAVVRRGMLRQPDL